MRRAGTVAVCGFAGITILGVVFAVNGTPQLLTFRPLESIGDLLQRLTPLFIIALFVERAIEVFVSPWRSREEAVLRAGRRTELGKLTEDEDNKLPINPLSGIAAKVRVGSPAGPPRIPYFRSIEGAIAGSK
jgi:hypothetical protein